MMKDWKRRVEKKQLNKIWNDNIEIRTQAMA